MDPEENPPAEEAPAEMDMDEKPAGMEGDEAPAEDM
jgi:hypothetical protein